MARPIQWFRLYRGRVWHAYAGDPNPWAAALCGQVGGADVEEQTGQPPRGGRPCPACREVAALVEWVGIEAHAVWAARHRPDQWADDVVDAEIVDDDEGDEPTVGPDPRTEDVGAEVL